MFMTHRILLTLRNPLVMIPPLIVALGIGWQQYSYEGRSFSLPDRPLNALPDGNFESFVTNGVPAGWQLRKNGDSVYATGQGAGYTGGKSFKITVSQYKNGDIAAVCPEIKVRPGKT